MTVNSTRRAVLAGAATIPALSIPAIASVVGNPDAELLALGKQFDQLTAEHEAACGRYEPQWDALEKAMAEYAEQRMADGRDCTNDEYAEICRRTEEQYPAAGPHPDKISDAMDAPMRRIMELQAQTIQGLKVKARVARFGCSYFWNATYEDADWDHLMARKMIDAILDTGIGS